MKTTKKKKNDKNGQRVTIRSGVRAGATKKKTYSRCRKRLRTELTAGAS